VLIGSRILWTKSFQETDQPYAHEGELDLREWQGLENSAITLDGQWEFYPSQWVLHKGSDDSLGVPHYIYVPGGWNTYLQSENDTPFGYGTYHLRVLVDPSSESTYSIRIPSIRSASALYVNGQLLSESGKLGESKENYVAENIPSSATFTADESGVIEVIIQAANYIDARNSGIIRSIKFGREDVLSQETELSESLQQMVAIVFLMHAIYALILFLLGSRDKRLLYFSILMGSMTFSNLLGSDHKLLHIWLPINYEWGFKFVHFFVAAGAYALLQFISYQSTGYWRIMIRWCIALSGVAGLLALIIPNEYMMTIQPLYWILIGVSIFVTMVSIFRMSIMDSEDNILILLSFIALMSSLLWWTFFAITGIKVMYYPFDLIIAMICFSSIWFRRYSRAHAETENLAIELQEEHRLKDEFLANTSHELRNPLHSILNILKGVSEREKYSLNEESIKDLKTVQSVGHHMALTLNDLLEAMNLKEGNPQLQLRRISIQSIVIGVMDMLQFMIEGKPVRLINEIPEYFPHVYADENRVIQIVFNLLHNAVKYTNDGEISIHGYVKDRKVDIVISDSGIGMDEETLTEIFKPYKQGKHGQTGIGLGLNITKKLVELHGGTLEARSVLGKGSEFRISLQVADPDIRTEGMIHTSSASLQPDIAAASTLKGSVSNEDPSLKANRPRLLIVDDEFINIRVIETILSTKQYHMMGVTSGSKALALLDLQEWDLVISDVMMPHMSGYELTRTIRERFTMTELPILLLTARSQSIDIEKGFLSGANDYVIKPVDALEIRSRVRVLTEVKRSAREQLQMEAAWLQAQIQPHFLFNTLNAITALSEIDLEKMHFLIDEFSSFLRSKFQFQIVDELKPIEEELNIVRSYLYIQQVRFNERLNVNWEIDNCTDVKIPLLTIQPLVENAVEHGIMKRVQGGNLTIRITNDETHIKIVVEDDGVGMDEATLHRILDSESGSGLGVGLINTDLRLKRQFGQGLEINSKLDEGTSVSFTANKKVEMFIHEDV